MIMIKGLIKNLVERRGYSIVKKNHFSHVNFDAILNVLYENVLARNESKLTVLQIGANDGQTNDPLNKFLSGKDIDAILIEPIKDVFDKLKMTYTKEDFKFVNNAISDVDDQLYLYRISKSKFDDYRRLYKQDANPTGITSFNMAHLESFLSKVAPDYFEVNGFDGWIEKTSVEGITFQTLYKKFGINNVSVLQVDTEGFDYEILKMYFSSGMNDPLIINFEYKLLSEWDVASALSMLAGKGYSYFRHSSGDICAFKNLEFS